MRRIRAPIALVAILAIAGTAAPVITSEGELRADLPSGAIACEVSFAVSCDGALGGVAARTELAARALERVTFTADAVWEGIEFAAEIDFDAVRTCSRLRIATSATTGPVVVNAAFLAEPGAVAFGLELRIQDGTPLEEVAIGWNLNAASGEIQTATCGLPFSFARVALRLPLSCEWGTLRATSEWTADGFDQLAVSFGPTPEVLPGLRFSVDLTCAVEEKVVQLEPSLSLGTRFCVTPLLLLDWDQADARLDGAMVLALDLGCKIGAVRVRGIVELSPGEVSLVADPYCGLLGLIWPVAGCCEEKGQASVAFFLGDDGLFDIEAVALEAEIALLPGLMLNPKAFLRIDGTAELSLGWTYDSSRATASD